MNPQLTIDFVSRRQNNAESQRILDGAVVRLNSQCLLLLDLFKSGRKLTVRSAMIEYGIGDLRRRVADLKEHGFKIESEIQKGGFKIYWIEN